MRRIQYFLSVFLVATRRLWHQRGLATSMILGLVAAVALTVCIPIYADAISYRILHAKLYNNPEDARSPFSFLLRYVGSWHGYLEWEACNQVDVYISDLVSRVLGLPEEMVVRHFKTDKMRLFPSTDLAYADLQKPLTYIALGFISDLESHINILDGRLPQPVVNNTEPIEVLVTSRLVEELGIQVGEEYIVYYQEPLAEGAQVQTTFQHPIRIAGVWQARDPEQEYWFYSQSAFDEVMLMPEASYVQTAQGMRGEVGLALWSVVCNGDQIRADDVGSLLGRIAVVRNKTNALLNDVELARSPEDALLSYSRTARLLTVVLYVFSVPILGLIMYFISLIAAMIVQRQRNEVAMLRSRGTTTWQVVGIYFLEGAIVGAISVVAGSLLGERLAQVIGLTRSFLVLEDRPFLPTVLSWANLRFGVLAIVASLLASIGPAYSASRSTVVTYKQEQARSLRAPLWQRMFLDVFLLIPALYGYYLLLQRGTISFVGKGTEASGSPFSNPFLFLVPVVFVFALALMAIRFFPLLMRFFSWLVNVWRGAVPVLVLRHLSRTAKQYTGPLLLLILTLSLAIFTASMARTLDDYIVAKSYYDVGADFRLVEMGQSTQEGMGGGMFGGGSSEGQQEEQDTAEPEWLFLPVSEHLNVPGVQAATRMWTKVVNVKLSGRSVKGQLVGIDRIDLPQTAFFRRDFAPASLGALMNALAVRNDAILVSREVLSYGVTVGDKVSVQIPSGIAPEVDFSVAGVVDMFPRMYPEDGVFFVANLDFIFDVIGGMYPYDVWLKADPSLTTEDLTEGVRDLGINVMTAYNARERIDTVQLQPDRQGVFGLLSVGFVIAAFLTVLGFLIYSYISFLQRYIELGVLRAIGLSVGQMASLLASEQLTLILTGTALGTLLGVLVSDLFIPFLQVEGGEHPFTPPFVVQIAWAEITYIYAVFGAMFLVAVVALLLSLRRMRIFEAVKLGEAV